MRTHDQPPIDSPERRRLPPLLRRAWFSLNQAFRRRIAHLALTPDQFTALRTLLEQEEVTQRELTHAMSSDANTVASLLARMERLGLVERRTHDKDRRVRRVRATREGLRRYREARQTAVALQAEVMSSLPEDEREKFLMNLHTLADSCRVAAGQSTRAG